MIDGYAAAAIVRTVFDFLLKGGSNALPTVGGAAAIFLLYQGLRAIRTHSESSLNERRELLTFIQESQTWQRQLSQESTQALYEITKSLALLNQRFEIRERAQETWNTQAAEKLEKINEDVWKARG